LAKQLSSDCKVTVVCPLPNYPKGSIFEDYKGKWMHKTTVEGIRVHRLWLFASNSKNKVLRFFAMLSFSFSMAWYFATHKIPKTVIVQSPPLLVAFTALLFLNKKRHKLILNVSDLWPRAGLELGAFSKGFTYSILQKTERYNYNKAHCILGQSEEILQHVRTRSKKPKVLLYRNYPDFTPPKIEDYALRSSEKIKLVYAGLLGVAQGILKLCKNLDYSTIEFHIYGSGTEEAAIINFITKNPDLPIWFHGRVARHKLHSKLLNYDVTIIPLLHRIYGSVPSKIFEYARLGLPILYFGGGEGETIVKHHNLGWVANAGNYAHLNTTIKTISLTELNTSLRKHIQKKAITHFDVRQQVKQLKQMI